MGGDDLGRQGTVPRSRSRNDGVAISARASSAMAASRRPTSARACARVQTEGPVTPPGTTTPRPKRCPHSLARSRSTSPCAATFGRSRRPVRRLRCGGPPSPGARRPFQLGVHARTSSAGREGSTPARDSSAWQSRAHGRPSCALHPFGQQHPVVDGQPTKRLSRPRCLCKRGCADAGSPRRASRPGTRRSRTPRSAPDHRGS